MWRIEHCLKRKTSLIYILPGHITITDSQFLGDDIMLIEGLASNKLTYYHSPKVFRINKVNKQIQIRKAFFTLTGKNS